MHPTVNLIAAGHDTGMIVFKLQRERPPYAVSEGNLYFVKDNYIRAMSFDTARDTPLLLTKKVSISFSHKETSAWGNWNNFVETWKRERERRAPKRVRWICARVGWRVKGYGEGVQEA